MRIYRALSRGPRRMATTLPILRDAGRRVPQDDAANPCHESPVEACCRQPHAAPFAIRAERASDVAAREALLDACFGANRAVRTCQRLRDGRAPAELLSFRSCARQAGGDGAVVARQRRGRASAACLCSLAGRFVVPVARRRCCA